MIPWICWQIGEHRYYLVAVGEIDSPEVHRILLFDERRDQTMHGLYGIFLPSSSTTRKQLPAGCSSRS